MPDARVHMDMTKRCQRGYVKSVAYASVHAQVGLTTTLGNEIAVYSYHDVLLPTITLNDYDSSGLGSVEDYGHLTCILDNDVVGHDGSSRSTIIVHLNYYV